MTNSLKRRLSDPDLVDPTKKAWKGKGKSVTTLEITRKRTPYHDHQEKVFANLRLKRILKENHGHDINQLSLFFNNKNFAPPIGSEQSNLGTLLREQHDTSNVLGTVGGPQINIYDNEHIGDNLDIMSNFNLARTLTDDQDLTTKNLNTFCWLSINDDALIAAGGVDGDIHVISITKSEEIATLKGHTKRILDIQRHPQNEKYILSVSKDGSIRLWDVEKQQCVVIYEYQCNVSCFHPSGNTFITGTTNGELREWNIPGHVTAMNNDYEQVMEISLSNSRILNRMHGDSTIDCIRYANGNVLSKSINGRMEYWDPTNEQSIRSIRVKTGENYCRFDVTSDGLYFCVGSSRGTVYIYNLETGKIVTELSHRRAIKAVRCCIFTHDCRHVLCGAEDGLIWRYDYIDDETLEIWGRLKT